MYLSKLKSMPMRCKAHVGKFKADKAKDTRGGFSRILDFSDMTGMVGLSWNDVVRAYFEGW